MTPLGIDPGTVRLVAQRLNHYATPGPVLTNVFSEIIYGSNKLYIIEYIIVFLTERHFS
jgi:hypothetical protein